MSLRQLLGVPAPAKLNLLLHITGRRDDGYHLLQSVFMLIDWCDTLHFERRAAGELSREDLGSDTAEPLPEDDLCLRAARLLQKSTGCTWGVHIILNKRIPTQAGMGGGSSDAASCLIALNRLWGLGLTRKQLSELGQSLGADVPFFLGGRNAWVQGTGEQLLPVSIPAADFLVVKPPQGVSTPAIFGSAWLKRDTETAIIQGFAANDERSPNAEQIRSLGAGQEVLRLDLAKIWAQGRNDLQPVAEALCPGITRCLHWMGSRHLQGRMTGSGSAVFAHLPPEQRKDQLLTAWSSANGGWASRVCSNMDAHPLLGW